MRKAEFFILLLIFVGFLNAQVASNFNSDLENWVVEGDSNYGWSASAGNPLGCIIVYDYAVGDINKAYAPHKFLGDWTGASATDFISMDIHLNTPTADYIGENVNHVFEISGPGGDAWAIANPTPANHSWTTYSISISESNWNITRGNWSDLLYDVQSLILTTEYIEGDETDKLDNVYLSFSPINLPVTIGTISDFEQSGYDGWSFINVTGVTNEISGGNPHRYLSINGNSDFTVGTAPPKFTGSWQQVENNAAIFVDLKKISTNLDHLDPPYLFKIYNDSSTAIFPVPNNFNLRLGQWVTVKAMIDENDWNILNGSWDNLMQNVAGLKVALDFYNSQSNIGMDNFRIDDQPPQVNFTVDKRDIFIGEEVNFIDLTANSPDSWFWEFGDGQTATIQNPTHFYTSNANSYDVSLRAYNAFGTDSLFKDNYITVYDPADDFEDDRINNLWETVRGNWREENGYLEQTSNVGSGDELNQGCFAVMGKYDWTNYEVRADIYNLDNEGVGVVLDYIDNDNFYLFQWDNNLYQQAAIYRYQNGTQYPMQVTNLTYESNTHYFVKFSNIFGKIELSINDSLIFSFTDRSLSEGKGGLWCSGSSGARYYESSIVFQPAPPQDVEILRSGSNVTLQWNPVPNAASYNIYSSDDDDVFSLEIEGVSANSWTGSFSEVIKFFRVTANK